MAARWVWMELTVVGQTSTPTATAQVAVKVAVATRRPQSVRGRTAMTTARMPARQVQIHGVPRYVAPTNLTI